MQKRSANPLPFSFIEGGWFPMGSDDGADNERPIHRVWVDSFELAVCPVTNAEYALFLNGTGYEQPPSWNDAAFSAPGQPVVAVSWTDAMRYCEWISSATDRQHRLPTEAEWEFAARGGAQNRRYPWGDAAPHYPAPAAPLVVGRRESNLFGLYDMCENVHEWCSDWYAADYYASSPSQNPRGPDNGTRRVSRGGSWRHKIPFSRCAARSSLPPAFRYTDYGFRIARDAQ